MAFTRFAIVALVLTVAAPVDAQQSARAVKRMDWGPPDHRAVRADGLHVLTYYLNEEAKQQVRRQQVRSAENVFSYMTYTSLIEPDVSGDTGLSCFDVKPRPHSNLKYNYVLVVANLGSDTYTGTVTFKLTGPVKWKRSFPNVHVHGESIVALYFETDSLEAAGNYMLKSTLTGAGSLKSRFCAGCTLPVVQERSARAIKGMDWGPPDHRTVRADGLYMLAYNLSDEAKQQFRGDKNVLPYMPFTILIKPKVYDSGFGCFGVMPIPDYKYNYALVVANLGSDIHTGTLTFKLAGPVKWKQSFPNVAVPGESLVVLHFKADALETVGNYLLKGTLTGAGSLKSRFCAGCTLSTPGLLHRVPARSSPRRR